MERNIHQCEHTQPLKSMKLLGAVSDINTDGFCVKTILVGLRGVRLSNIHKFNLGIEA